MENRGSHVDSYQSQNRILRWMIPRRRGEKENIKGQVAKVITWDLTSATEVYLSFQVLISVKPSWQPPYCLSILQLAERGVISHPNEPQAGWCASLASVSILAISVQKPCNRFWFSWHLISRCHFDAIACLIRMITTKQHVEHKSSMKSFRSGSQAYKSPDSHGSWDWFPLALCFGTAISKSFSVKDRETKNHQKTAKLSIALQKMTSSSLKNFTCPAEREHPYCTSSQLFILKDRFILQDRVHHLLASKGSPIYLCTMFSSVCHLVLGRTTFNSTCQLLPVPISCTIWQWSLLNKMWANYIFTQCNQWSFFQNPSLKY